MNQYLSKGALIGIEGRIQTRNYDDNSGRKVYVTEVICDSVAFLEPKRNVEEQNQQSKQNTYKTQNQAYKEHKMQPQGKPVQYAGNLTAQAEMDTLDISPDDLPF